MVFVLLKPLNLMRLTSTPFSLSTSHIFSHHASAPLLLTISTRLRNSSLTECLLESTQQANIASSAQFAIPVVSSAIRLNSEAAVKRSKKPFSRWLLRYLRNSSVDVVEIQEALADACCKW